MFKTYKFPSDHSAFFQSMFAVIYKKRKMCFNVLEESIISAGVISIVFFFCCFVCVLFYLHQDTVSCLRSSNDNTLLSHPNIKPNATLSERSFVFGALSNGMLWRDLLKRHFGLDYFLILAIRFLFFII